MAPTSILSASARSLERMVSFLERNALVLVVDASVGFNEVDAALALLAASPFGKVVIDLSKGDLGSPGQP